MCGKAKRKFTASQSVWWGFIIRKFTYKTECYVEPNVTLSCEAPRRGAPDCEQASNLRVVAEPQPWHGYPLQVVYD